MRPAWSTTYNGAGARAGAHEVDRIRGASDDELGFDRQRRNGGVRDKHSEARQRCAKQAMIIAQPHGDTPGRNAPHSPGPLPSLAPPSIAARYRFSRSRISRNSSTSSGVGGGAAGAVSSLALAFANCLTIQKITNARMMKLMTIVRKLP